jgi:dCMP deaminase
MEQRITRDELYINIAKLMAMRGTCERAKVGAVLVQGGRIISCGYNGSGSSEPHCSEKGCDVTNACNWASHAEKNALKWALSNFTPIRGATLYCTHSPCVDCASYIVVLAKKGHKLEEVVYLEDYRIIRGITILNNNGIKTRKITDGRNFITQV